MVSIFTFFIFDSAIDVGDTFGVKESDMYFS